MQPNKQVAAQLAGIVEAVRLCCSSSQTQRGMKKEHASDCKKREVLCLMANMDAPSVPSMSARLLRRKDQLNHNKKGQNTTSATAQKFPSRYGRLPDALLRIKHVLGCGERVLPNRGVTRNKRRSYRSYVLPGTGCVETELRSGHYKPTSAKTVAVGQTSC